MATQTSYSEHLRSGVPGHIPDMSAADLISRTIESAVGIGFGLPVFQGTTDKGVLPTGSAFVGVTVLDRSATGPNGYVQYESARLIRKGPVMVLAAVAVRAGDPVTLIADGGFSNTGGVALANARWDTSTASPGQVATIILGSPSTVTEPAEG